ncbi:hypothetical protein BFW41_00220 [Aeromonas hydrophila]|uniref:DUF6314 family protein n=1 Tax=Aeromonas TaxID=642 RepID=UPI000E5817D9|nr:MULTISPECIES: DUF6314 family protein [Aeromonas]AXV32439.1 hypothetical protein BFW41_00220 [Aeromonas hydrophila]EHA1068469.1 hypothetical protein [Aeromonas hydrophila]MBM0438957.1 hypothetical protein [Aeromonas hydrophila subsp. ranae]MBW3828525.1 hypothetical protein [Aeromonas hydrophila]MCX4116247.1 DUF6314 family protein [Aeromonas hydrophila]
MAEMEALIQRLWRQLPQIGAFSFTASNGAGSATDWCGSGEGEVTVTDHHGGWLFAELGRYTTPHGRVLTMHNRFWWQRSEQGILLSHLRYEQPVVLFELLPQADGRWLTAEPHLCGQDHYSAELTPTGDGFLLGWQITGPRKNERLSYRYRV